jgi:calcineurin-like phosphoesterase family protein
MQFKTIIININETNVFFISDTHFQHSNIIKYCNRPFETVVDMDSTMIENWNSVVGEDDIVFHLGDFCFGSKKSWKYLLDRLNGKKYLAVGNHDKNIPPDKFIDIQHRFNIRIIGDPEMTSDGQRITVDHYPMFSWYQSHRGAFQLYGHVHGGLSNKGMNESKLTPNQLDVGVDVHNFTPIPYEKVKEIITKQNLQYYDHT